MDNSFKSSDKLLLLLLLPLIPLLLILLLILPLLLMPLLLLLLLLLPLFLPLIFILFGFLVVLIVPLYLLLPKEERVTVRKSSIAKEPIPLDENINLYHDNKSFNDIDDIISIGSPKSPEASMYLEDSIKEPENTTDEE